jgi:hypothetical protein
MYICWFRYTSNFSVHGHVLFKTVAPLLLDQKIRCNFLVSFTPLMLFYVVVKFVSHIKGRIQAKGDQEEGAE